MLLLKTLGFAKVVLTPGRLGMLSVLIFDLFWCFAFSFYHHCRKGFGLFVSD
jgi:hypothetical protein